MTYDYVLEYDTACLISSMSFDRCVIIFNIFPHGLHWFDGLFIVVAWLIIMQVTLNLTLILRNLQMYLENSVLFSYFWRLNDLL